MIPFSAITCIITALILCQLACASNILMLHPVVSRSHELVFVELGEELASRGHDVTLVRFKGRNLRQTNKVRSIFLEIQKRSLPYMEPDGTVEPPQRMLWESSATYGSVPWDLSVPICAACETLMENVHLVNATTKGEKYDLAIVDILGNECGLALANSLNVPVIAYWASVMHGGELLFYAAPYPPSYVPGLVTGLTNRMNFLERIENFVLLGGAYVFSYFVLLRPPYRTYSKYLVNAPEPSFLINNISALFVNTDFSLDFSRPVMPNTVNVGCLWCRPAQPLPAELEAFMQSAGEHGVVAFSLGATFNADFVPKSAIQAFLKAMGRLPQKIIMKLEGQVDAELPSNILRVKWMPQQDILGHPQTRAFVSHCGMHGVMEAIYHQVPIVGMPIFADQFDVLARLMDRGIAVKLDKRNLEEEIIYNALVKVLYDKSYKENTIRVSSIMKDSPQTAMERAVYWVEYIIRHRGAPHLKSGDRHLNLFQYWMLDVILFLLACISTVFFVFSYLTLYIFNKLRALLTIKRKAE